LNCAAAAAVKMHPLAIAATQPTATRRQCQWQEVRVPTSACATGD